MDWEDPNLLREIEAATGKSLTLKKGKGKGRGKSSKKPTTNLTDLKKLAKKPRSRLEKKIFSRCVCGCCDACVPEMLGKSILILR